MINKWKALAKLLRKDIERIRLDVERARNGSFGPTQTALKCLQSTLFPTIGVFRYPAKGVILGSEKKLPFFKGGSADG